MGQAREDPREDHLRRVRASASWGRGAILRTWLTVAFASIEHSEGADSPALAGSAGFRAAPRRRAGSPSRRASRPSIPTDRQASPAAFRFGSSSGRRVRPRSSRQRTSQSAEPRNSQTKAIQGWSVPVAHQQHHPGGEGEEEQQVEVPDAPDPAELEEERHAAEQRQEEPDLGSDSQVETSEPLTGPLSAKSNESEPPPRRTSEIVRGSRLASRGIARRSVNPTRTGRPRRRAG